MPSIKELLCKMKALSLYHSKVNHLIYTLWILLSQGLSQKKCHIPVQILQKKNGYKTTEMCADAWIPVGLCYKLRKLLIQSALRRLLCLGWSRELPQTRLKRSPPMLHQSRYSPVNTLAQCSGDRVASGWPHAVSDLGSSHWNQCVLKTWQCYCHHALVSAFIY